MSKEVAAKIEELLNESRAKVKEAMALADQHGLEFGYEPDHIGHYYGVGFEDLQEGEWYPSSWSSSSLYC